MFKGEGGKTILTKLKENTVAPDGMHYLDLANSLIGPKELKMISDVIKSNFQAIESGLAPLISIELPGNQLCNEIVIYVLILLVNHVNFSRWRGTGKLARYF